MTRLLTRVGRAAMPGAADSLLATAALLAGVVAIGGPTGGPTLAQGEAAADGATSLGSPDARGAFGEPLTFSTPLIADAEPIRVELLTSLPGEPGWRVSIADVGRVAEGRWQASVIQAGHVVPNTTYRYRFRALTADGVVLGPEASHRVADERLEWQVRRGERVDLWWHEGDASFAERAALIAEEAVDAASALFGVDEVVKVDFFVYSDARAFRQAMGPGTRENVGGQAHPGIRTLFGLIEPSQVRSGWVDELIIHELAHLVFDEAVRNPYGYPPRWLNEGLAVHLSTGYTEGDRQLVESAARAETIIPLDGLRGQFPTRARRFTLAYAESVSAVDFFIRTYGREGLAALLGAFARGSSTDEAFRAVTGSGFTEFDDAWLASVGARRPEPVGPQPVPSGPLPAEWRAEPEPLLR
ncbi:hypothetical protein BH24CHL9_BH24CHL9_07680 [soil metagenome]